jgi:hypothetical protein
VNPGTGRVPAVTTNTPTGAETTCTLRRRFPGALIWRGKATGHWWSYVPVGPRGRLVEAAYPAELAHRLESAAQLTRPFEPSRQDPPPARPDPGHARSPHGLMGSTRGGDR